MPRAPSPLLTGWLLGRITNWLKPKPNPVMMTRLVEARFPGHPEEGAGGPPLDPLKVRLLGHPEDGAGGPPPDPLNLQVFRARIGDASDL